MSRRLIEIVGMQGGDNKPGQLALPMGLDYIRFFSDTGDATATAADFSTVRLFANGGLLREYSGAQQDDMNFSDKIPNLATQADGILEMPLEMLGMKDAVQQLSTTLCTFSPDPQTKAAITSARFEQITAGIGAPAIRFWAEVDDSGNGGPGWVERVNAYGPFPLTNGTEASVSAGAKMPYGTIDRQYWRRMFISYPGHNVNLLRILRGSDNAEILKMTLNMHNRILSAGDSVRQKPGGTVFNYLWDSGVRGMSEPVDTIKAVAADGTITPWALDARITGDAAANATIVLSTLGKL